MITDRICLYESDETDFTTHGIADLETLITEIDVVEKGNTAFSLTACFDIADDRAMLIEKGRIIGCMTNNGTFEPFRIKETSKLMSEIEVYAEHIMFDLADNLIEDCYVDTKSGQFAGTHFLESTQFEHKFTFTSNIPKIASSRMVRKDPITALISDEDNSFVSRWGGELTVNQYDIKINEHGGEDRGFTINYSENMEGLNYNEDDSEVYTRCMPEGYDGLFLPEKYVDSDKLNDYITPKIRVVKFSDIKYVEKEYDGEGNDVTEYDPEDHTKNADGEYVDIEAAYAALRQCARALFTEQHVDEPRRSCSADLTLYQDTEEYSSVSALLTLRLWDTVTVHHEQQNVDIQLQCIETHFNPLRGALTSVSLGDEVPSYSNSKDNGIDNETMQKIEEAVNNSNATGPSKSQVQEMINNAMKEATDKINSGLGGYVVKTREELLIMDTEDVNTATKVWRWNVNGLGYSSSGYAGPYYTAMTSDGKFVINEVTCQKFTASLINAGILRSVDNSSWFDLENGTFSWANGQIVFDGTELTIKIGSQTIDDVLDSVFTIIVNKEHQIIPLDSNSFPVDNGSYKFTFTVLKGNTTTETPCIVNKVTPKTEINGVSFIMSNNTCTMNVDKSVRMLGVNGDEFEVELEILDYLLTKTISWSTVLQGRDGQDGVNGTNGVSSYWHIKYAPVANPTAGQMSEEVNTYIGTYVDNIEADSNDPESYTWSRLIGENGQDGIPGTNGTDGKTTYLHIKYSDDMVSFTANNGETPGKYMGQYVDFIETDSLVFNDYIWAQIKGNDGRDGVDGTNGTPGISSYFHVKYAPNNNPTADQMTDTPQEYIGTYVDSNIQDSNDPSKYTWIKIQGNDGTSITIDYTVETLPTTGEVGKYYYVNGTGILWRYEDSGWVKLGKIQGPQGIPGTNGVDGKTQYLHIKYSNDNGATFTTNNGEDVGMYIGTYVDFIEADSNEVSDYKWARMRGEDGVNASFVKIVETSRLFTMPQGATEYSPSSIALTPQFTNCTFGKWQYSTNGGSSWTNVTNGLNGLTISNGVLSISNTSALYTDSITSVSFKVTASDGSSDVTTITRLKDGIDGADGTDGKNGTNGVSATNIILGNENHTFQATSDGNAVATSITFDIDGYVGTTEKAVTVGTISGVPTGMTITKNGSGTTNASLIVKVTTSMTSLNGIVTIPCTCNGLTFNKQFTYSLSVPGRDGQDGINGTNGIDGTSSYFHIKYSPVANPTSSQMTETPNLYIGTYVDQSPTDSTDPSRYTWSKFQGVDGNNGRDGTPGVDGKDGTTYYLHIKYSDDGERFTANDGETPGDYLGQYVDTTKADSTTFSKYTWKKIKGDKGDQGIRGPAGSSSYFHIKYSAIANPTLSSQMTETPSDYIGTYVDSNAADSTDPSRYTWSRFRGQDGNNGIDGTPGINGADGKTYYLHIKYSNDGATFTSNNGEDPGAWLGQYVDENKADSTIFSKYTWAKIKGDDGANASYVRIDETSQVFLKAKGATAYTPASIKLTPVFTNSAYSKWQYSINNGSSWTNVTSGSNGLTISNGVLTVANTCNLFTNSVQSVIFKVTGTNNTADTMTLVRISDGADGATPNFNILPKTNQGTTNWNWSMQYGDYTKTAVMEDGINCCKLTRGNTAQSGWSVIEYSPINREKFKTNTRYTISVEVKSSVASSVNVQLKNGDSSNPITDGLWLGNTVANTWTKLSGTLATYSTFPSSTGQKVYFTGFNSGTGVSHMFRNLKIEEGTEATTWLPTVEELHGNDATVIQLSNENHTFAATSNGKAVASSITVDIYGFVGATAKATTIGTISGTPAGMTITKNNSGTTYASLTIAVTTSMSTTAGTVSIPITCNGVTFNKVFTYSLSVPGRDGANGADGKDGADGADGKNGTNASYVMASPTTQFFKCPADSTTYSPTSITITPSFVNCSYSSWQYSVDGGKVWANVTSGSRGLTISNGVLTVASSSSLFTTSITSIAFKVNASGSKYDIVTISKLKDGNTGATGAEGATPNYNLIANSHNMGNTFSTAGGYQGTKSLVVDTGAQCGYHFETKCTTAGSGPHFPVFPKTTDRIGNTYTWSFWAKSSVAKTVECGHECGGRMAINLTTSWKKFTKTWTFTDAQYHSFTFYATSNWAVGEILYIKDFKIEEGNRATTWLPTVNEMKGVSVTGITNYYLVSSSSSGVTTSTSGWSTRVPTMTTTNKYLWNYEGVTYSNSTTSTTTPCIIGVYGNTGNTGAAGKGISSITEYYLVSSSSSGVTASTSGWSTTVPTMTTTNKYLWNYEVTRYSDNSTTTGSPKVIGVYGNTGATGATGAAGKDSINIILGNENHTFAASSNGNAVATSVATSVVGYKGTTKTACTVGTISGLPTGMTATINSNGTTSASVTFTVTTSLTTKNGSVTIPVTCGGITINKIFSYSLAVAGANGTNGTNGTNAKLVKINASTNVFKSTDGGVTFAPTSISLIPAVQNVSFSKWQYSTNGSSFTNVTSGQHGLTINGSTLVVNATCDLFTDTVTTLAVRAVSSTSTVYDTITLYKLYDRTDINDAFEEMELTVSQSNTKWEAAFKNSNANNMLLNSDFKTGTSDDWINNGGGITVGKANAFPFYGSTEYYLKTSFPSGVRYAHDVQLEPNTDYVYEGYIYVNASLTGTNITPLNFWIWKGNTPTSTRLCTIVDYRQTLTSGRFVKCYVHFKTSNVAESLYGRFFVYHTGTSSNVGVKRMSLKKGTVETEWTQHPNEVKSIVTSIDQDGVKVKHSEAGTYTQMDSTGFSIRDSETGDVFAWLSSKEQWTELKVDKVFAGNIENVYEGGSNLYVNHAATVAGDGTANKPFNSFQQLAEYLEATPVINKDLYITVRDPGVEINEQLHLMRLKGTGFIKIILEGKLVIRSRGTGQPCIRLAQIQKWVWIVSGREFGSSTTGAVLCDAGNGHGILAYDVDRLEIDALTIACKNWGIKTERTHLYTWHVDFGKCYNAIELQYQSIYYSSDDVGSCVDFVRLKSGSFAYWGCGTVRPQGNVQRSNGIFYDSGSSLTPTASPRYSSSNPSAPTTGQVFTYTYDWTSHKTYAYSYSNWSDSDCKQGSWGYGLRGGHMFFDISTIRSQMTGTIQDGNTITLTRANSGGKSEGANVYINGSTCSSASGTPSYGGQTLLGTLAWGETKTFTLPKAIVQGLVSGSYNSLAVYVNNTASNCYLNIVNAKITLKTKK